MGKSVLEIAAVLLVLYGTVSSQAQAVRKIQANSFLLEEAYNQEYGVVQHIQFFQLVNDDFNLMLEVVGNTIETVGDGGRTETENSFIINPGMRLAINCKAGLQIVPGLSLPIGVGPSQGEFGILLYPSFEHPLFRPKPLSRWIQEGRDSAQQTNRSGGNRGMNLPL